MSKPRAPIIVENKRIVSGELRIGNFHSLFATPYSPLLSAAVAQTGGNAVDRDLDAAQHLLVGVLRPVLLQKLHVHVVQRIEIGKAVADRALEKRVTFQQACLPGDLQQPVDRTLPLAPDTLEDVLAKCGVGYEFGIT